MANRERGRLTHAAYATIGGLAGAIATRAEAELQKLTPQQRDALRQVMIRLVSPGEGKVATRARAQIPSDPAAAKAIGLFADARLLTTGFDEVTDQETVEVSHEALIAEWRTYREWIDADREFIRTVERIKAARRAWADEEGDKDSRLLAPGRPLEEARELLTRPHALLDDIRPFIEASIARDETRVAAEQARIDAEKRREIEQVRKVAAAERGRRRVAVAALVGALLLAIATGWFALKAERAMRTALERESRRLASLSREVTARGDSIDGMALALEGLPRDLHRPDRPLVNETVVALGSALQAPYYTARILRGHEMTIKAAAFSPDVAPSQPPPWIGRSGGGTQPRARKSRCCAATRTSRRRSRGSYFSLMAAFTFAAISGGMAVILWAVLACSAPLAITSASSFPSMTALQPGIKSPHLSTFAMIGLPLIQLRRDRA